MSEDITVSAKCPLLKISFDIPNGDTS